MSLRCGEQDTSLSNKRRRPSFSVVYLDHTMSVIDDFVCNNCRIVIGSVISGKRVCPRCGDIVSPSSLEDLETQDKRSESNTFRFMHKNLYFKGPKS